MSDIINQTVVSVLGGKGSAAEVVKSIDREGLKYVKEVIAGKLLPVLEDKKATAESKKAVFEILAGVVGEFGGAAVPHLWDILIAGLRGVSEKKEEVAQVARTFVSEMVTLLTGETLVKLVPILLTAMAGKEKWQTKELALNIMQEKASAYPKFMSLQLSLYPLFFRIVSHS
eukprot:TRINITY_DN11001_c0_g2_i2.p2 TRINITY_DN11001_c0_g2~~TRINITY_DN11001_c0_g2_i2.p2  ORF type:complete len:172 (+),score=34.09 TRINITY_DN11001_c0_g2_i2:189-704(+)